MSVWSTSWTGRGGCSSLRYGLAFSMLWLIASLLLGPSVSQPLSVDLPPLEAGHSSPVFAEVARDVDGRTRVFDTQRIAALRARLSSWNPYGFWDRVEIQVLSSCLQGGMPEGGGPLSQLPIDNYVVPRGRPFRACQRALHEFIMLARLSGHDDEALRRIGNLGRFLLTELEFGAGLGSWAIVTCGWAEVERAEPRLVAYTNFYLEPSWRERLDQCNRADPYSN